MALIIAYIILITIIVCTVKKSQNNENPLNKANSVALKGIFCVLIMFHHLFQNLYNNGDWFLRRLNNILGGVGVGVFFFLSAFGLVASYKKKGKPYIKQVLTKNIPLLYLTYVFTNLLAFLIFQIGKLSFKDAVFKILGFNFLYKFSNLNPNSWFMTTIILFYFLFCIVYAICGKNTRKAAIIMTITTIIYNIVIIILEKTWLTQLYLYDRAIICFALGCVYATYYELINNFLSKHYYETILYSLAIIVFGVLVVEDISAIGTCLLIITLLQRNCIKSKSLTFLGVISFYVYILHGIIIALLKKVNTNQYFLVFGVLTVSIISAYTYYLIRKFAFKIFTKKLKGEIK